MNERLLAATFLEKGQLNFGLRSRKQLTAELLDLGRRRGGAGENKDIAGLYANDLIYCGGCKLRFDCAYLIRLWEDSHFYAWPLAAPDESEHSNDRNFSSDSHMRPNSI